MGRVPESEDDEIDIAELERKLRVARMKLAGEGFWRSHLAWLGNKLNKDAPQLMSGYEPPALPRANGKPSEDMGRPAEVSEEDLKRGPGKGSFAFDPHGPSRLTLKK